MRSMQFQIKTLQGQYRTAEVSSTLRCIETLGCCAFLFLQRAASHSLLILMISGTTQPIDAAREGLAGTTGEFRRQLADIQVTPRKQGAHHTFLGIPGAFLRRQ